jgi:hypothetical protein
VSDPAVGGVQYTVLEIDNFLSFGSDAATLEAVDAEHGEDVSVAGSHQVLLKVKVIFIYDLFEGFANVRVGSHI